MDNLRTISAASSELSEAMHTSASPVWTFEPHYNVREGFRDTGEVLRAKMHVTNPEFFALYAGVRFQGELCIDVSQRKFTLTGEPVTNEEGSEWWPPLYDEWVFIAQICADVERYMQHGKALGDKLKGVREGAFNPAASVEGEEFVLQSDVSVEQASAALGYAKQKMDKTILSGHTNNSFAVTIFQHIIAISPYGRWLGATEGNDCVPLPVERYDAFIRQRVEEANRFIAENQRLRRWVSPKIVYDGQDVDNHTDFSELHAALEEAGLPNLLPKGDNPELPGAEGPKTLT